MPTDLIKKVLPRCENANAVWACNNTVAVGFTLGDPFCGPCRWAKAKRV